jgi:hypothetical protein
MHMLFARVCYRLGPAMRLAWNSVGGQMDHLKPGSRYVDAHGRARVPFRTTPQKGKTFERRASLELIERRRSHATRPGASSRAESGTPVRRSTTCISRTAIATGPRQRSAADQRHAFLERPGDTGKPLLGAVTAYLRSPTAGIWKRPDGTVDGDDVVMVEVDVECSIADGGGCSGSGSNASSNRKVLVRAIRVDPL